MSVKKQYLKSKPECKVTFILDKELAIDVNKANLTGDFNSWDETSIPMKKQKNGEFSVAINLEKDKEYQYKFLLDGDNWLNDPHADKFVPNVFQTENSVVIV